MRAILKLVLVIYIAAVPCAQAQTQSAALAALKPFRPQLTVNTAADICNPFLKAWTAAFEGNGALGEGAIDPAAIYPNAKVHTVKSFVDQLRIDFDNDGDLEVLHFEEDYLGWRFMGVEVYLFASEADYQIAAASKEHQWHG